jgi:hypothetical protein
VTGDWRKLHIMELYNIDSSPEIVRLIESRRIRCKGRIGGEDGKYVKNFSCWT